MPRLSKNTQKAWRSRGRHTCRMLDQLSAVMTPTEVAAALGVSEKTIYTWRRGSVPRQVTLEKLHKLAVKKAA